MEKCVLGIMVGVLLVCAAGCGGTSGEPPDETASPGATSAQVWTCSMHPQIRRPGPGKCPICAMDLIPLERAGDVGPREFVASDTAIHLMDVRVTPVERKFVTAEVRLVGKVAYDETRLGYITAWVPGRLDRLFVDYTGVPVKKGDHMVVLYSPQLLSAQEELLQAKKTVKEIERSRIDIMRENAQATVEAAREKLRLWGLTKEQIEEIEKRGKSTDLMQINAPMGGIVIEKHVQQGMYVTTGTRIYTIADLTRVWVKLDAYESDLKWLRYGQKVTFTTEAYPDEIFVGKIAFIDPVVDPTTRTVRVRVNVPNEAGKLKPNMFVRGVVQARVAAAGKVMDPDLAGKWVSPMHPEVVKDGPGTCDVCGMPLVRAEELGYVAAGAAEKAQPLVVPASAPLITGKRALVYVQVKDKGGMTFEGREVVLGPRAGDYYIVRSGLAEGDLVVVKGNFKMDSALQLEGRPSMMSPEGGGTVPHHHGERTGTEAPAGEVPKLTVPDEFRRQLAGVWTAYQEVASALAGDDFKTAAQAVDKAHKALGAVEMKLLTGDAHVRWMKALNDLGPPLAGMVDGKDIEAVRKGFALFSEALAAAIRTFGIAPESPVYRLHCPMAFNNRGANWLSDTKEIRNPYFGPAMPKCGDVIETISPRPAGGVHE